MKDVLPGRYAQATTSTRGRQGAAYSSAAGKWLLPPLMELSASEGKYPWVIANTGFVVGDWCYSGNDIICSSSVLSGLSLCTRPGRTHIGSLHQATSISPAIPKRPMPPAALLCFPHEGKKGSV